MNLIETGKLIAKLRKEAGYTQKELADALFVTDKAVSKWERGICYPDSSLFSKLSMLLDINIDYIFSDIINENYSKWVGELYINDFKRKVNDKPMLYYFLSYFMLAGIKNVSIVSKDIDYIKALNLERFGLKIYFQPFSNVNKKMIITGSFFLFGANLTRYFHNAMNSKKNICLKLNNIILPVKFINNSDDLDVEYKILGRGITYIPLLNDLEIEDATKFVNIYEKYNNFKIADLSEIAKLRNFIKK